MHFFSLYILPTQPCPADSSFKCYIYTYTWPKDMTSARTVHSSCNLKSCTLTDQWTPQFCLPSCIQHNFLSKFQSLTILTIYISGSKRTLIDTIRVHPKPCKLVHFYVRKSPSQSEQTSNFSLLIWLAGRFTHVEMYEFTRPRVYP